MFAVGGRNGVCLLDECLVYYYWVVVYIKAVCRREVCGGLTWEEVAVGGSVQVGEGANGGGDLAATR